MNIIRVSLLSLFVFISIGFAGNTEEGPSYLKGKHHKLGQDELHDGSTLGENSEIRFWMMSNFGKNISKKEMDKIAKKASRDIKKEAKTHKTNRWFWKNIKENEYLLIGYSDATNSQYSYAVIKKRKNDWIYRCNRDKYWEEVDEDDTMSCRLKKGYDIIKFELHNPENKAGWKSNDIMYRFAIRDR